MKAPTDKRREGKPRHPRGSAGSAAADRKLKSNNFNLHLGVVDALDHASKNTKVPKATLVRAALDHFFYTLSEEERATILDDYDGP